MKNGGCQCGAVRYELRGDAASIYACHCSECRRQSASAFGISVIHDPDDLSVTQGKPKSWSRITKSDEELVCWFCADCGSRLWHAAGGVISVKGGSLDEPPEPRSHIWTSSKLPWVLLPDGAETWLKEPPE